MKAIERLAILLGAIGIVIVTSGFAIDNHRCKRINYEQASYELPETWLISAKQCLDTANAIRLRRYAR
ncbi:MAG: hypothetical protein ACR2QJ_00065 [Geminicoccaceae bacterium]